MTNITKILALGATVAFAAVAWHGYAQDDLDQLLSDLEGDTATKTEAKAEAKAEAKGEEAKAEAKGEEAKAEAKAEEKAEEKVEEAKAEAKGEGEEAKEEAKAEAKGEGEGAKEEAKEEAKAEAKGEGEGAKEEEKAEEPKAEEKKEEVAEAEEVTEEKAEEKAEEKVEEAKAEAEEEEKAEEKKEEVAEAEEVTEEEAKGQGEEPKEEAKEEEKAEAKDQGEEAKEEPKVEAKKAEKKPVVAADPDAELLENLRTTEELRRMALDAQALKEMREARECMSNGEYVEAVRHYGLAGKYLNDKPSSKALRKECDQGVAEGLYRAALQEDKLGRRSEAVKLMEKALDMRHPKASRTLEKWLAEADPETKKSTAAELRHRQNDEDYKADREKIRKHLKRSRQLLAVRDMEKALEECEIVLAADQYNQEALRLRKAIQSKRRTILEQQREQAREGMIADVDEAWRPVYAVNAAQLNEPSAETVKAQAGEDPERTQEQEIERRMKEMRLPAISFKPPATIIDAVEFFRSASKDFDRPDIPIEKRGFNFVLKTPQGAIKQQAAQAEESSDDFTDTGAEADASAPTNGLDPIPTITASDITFFDALKLVCDSVDYKFIVRGSIVMVMQKDMSTAELLSRKYDVLDAFLERMTAASSDVKEMQSAGFGGGGKKKANDDGEENQERDWKAFFEQMGVKWPEGSSIMYIKTLGKLYVRNTRENLSEFEKVLQEMGSQPKLIEIETRFVEVSQEDLNSLGFEWILNSDYSLNLSGISDIKSGMFNGSIIEKKELTGYKPTTITEGGTTTQVLTPTYRTVQERQPTAGEKWVRNPNGGNGSLGINSFGGTSDYQNGNRYLSTMGNHISGEAKNTNDQFMRVNAFLGEADLSMILHMLSQRSDTDLLSAPKVVTKSGENAVIKVVTEYIYPQDYNVQLQSSSSGSSGGSSSGGSQSAILAVVEPQNFTMREQGVILDVTPTYSESNGGIIDLELKPQVVDEPTWMNYGMQIPFTGNSSSSTLPDIGNIISSAASAMATLGAKFTQEQTNEMASRVMGSSLSAIDNISTSGSQNMTWYDAPMKQPFFHVRSIDSKVSITPGATVVMGGLITEQRKAMDDKVPFLGDLPFIGRLFRSHAEQTNKRNLLIFVTGRLITPSGRELDTGSEEMPSDGEVKAAPSAE